MFKLQSEDKLVFSTFLCESPFRGFFGKKYNLKNVRLNILIEKINCIRKSDFIPKNTISVEDTSESISKITDNDCTQNGAIRFSIILLKT